MLSEGKVCVLFSPLMLVLWHYPAPSRSMVNQVTKFVGGFYHSHLDKTNAVFSLHLVCGIRNVLYTTFILVMTFWKTLEYECDRECVWIRACCWLENEESVGLLVFVFSNCLLQDLTFGYLTMPRSPTNQFHATVTSVSFASV